MRRKLLLICLSIAFCMPAMAQRKIVATEQFSDYNRNSISVLATRYGDEFDDVFVNTVSGFKVDKKYDKNELTTHIVNISVPRRFDTEEKMTFSKSFEPDQAIANRILGDLNRNNVGKEIFQYVLKPDEEGRFSREIIDERGTWNADDKDFIEAQMTQVDAMGQDGEKLIAKSYIIVYDMQNPHQVEVKTVDKDGNTVTKLVWVAEINAFVYKIANADNLIMDVLNNMWIYDTDDEASKVSKKQAFDDLQVNLEFVNSIGVRETNAELNEAIVLAKDELMYYLEKNIEEWQVTIDCETVKPYITAKIGRKEGVKNGARYGIYGQVYNKSEDRLEFKRKGYVRATVVANNMKVADGQADSTYFYRISGVEALKGNEILKQRNDLKMAVYVNGNLNGSISGPSSSRLFGSFAIANVGADILLNINKKGRCSYFVIEGGFDMNTASHIEKGCNEFGTYGPMTDYAGENYFKDGVMYLNVSVGFVYGFKLKQFVEIQPFLKIGIDAMTSGIDKDKMQALADKMKYKPSKTIDDDFAKQTTSYFVDPGLRVVFNVVYPVQLFAQANYSLNIYKPEAYKIINDYLKDCHCGHSNGLGVGAGVRVCF